MSEPSSTSAPFHPNNRKGLARFNAVEILLVLAGISACSTGLWGTIIGVPIILAGIYSAVLIPPKINRGLYIGKCPHCGADMSATHYQVTVDCPSCGGNVAIRDSRFVALPKSARPKAV